MFIFNRKGRQNYGKVREIDTVREKVEKEREKSDRKGGKGGRKKGKMKRRERVIEREKKQRERRRVRQREREKERGEKRGREKYFTDAKNLPMLLIFTNFYLFLMKHTATLLKLTKIYHKFATVNWQNTIY